MKNPRRKIVVSVGAALLFGSLWLAGAHVRTVRAYQPGAYNRTRKVMPNRAAVRKALRKAARKRRRAGRR